MWGIFVLASAEIAWKTGLILFVIGIGNLLAGIAAFYCARSARITLGAIALAAALSIEVFEILVLEFTHELFGHESAIVIAAGHGVPVLVFIIFYGLLHKAQSRVVAAINKRILQDSNAQDFIAGIANGNEVTTRAQALVRGYNARKLAIRRKELQAWAAMTMERRVIVALVYSILLVVIGSCAYINLLFGVTFTTSQSRAWVLASLTSFLTDAIINTPVVMLAKTVIFFLKNVMLTSLDTVLMGKVAMDAVKLPDIKQDKTAILGNVLTRMAKENMSS